jgi:hypothetical protein
MPAMRSDSGYVGYEDPDNGESITPSRHAGGGSLRGSTACLKDCVLGSLTKDSGTNVGIEDKIEQAMDLVKGHLMFAVREEVDLLKDEIQRLVARNSQLERENALLVLNAPADTLTELQAARDQRQQQTAADDSTPPSE